MLSNKLSQLRFVSSVIITSLLAHAAGNEVEPWMVRPTLVSRDGSGGDFSWMDLPDRVQHAVELRLLSKFTEIAVEICFSSPMPEMCAKWQDSDDLIARANGNFASQIIPFATSKRKELSPRKKSARILYDHLQ
jgi:hypothetical protein